MKNNYWRYGIFLYNSFGMRQNRMPVLEEATAEERAYGSRCADGSAMEQLATGAAVHADADFASITTRITSIASVEA
jgi:hypothetical protein